MDALPEGAGRENRSARQAGSAARRHRRGARPILVLRGQVIVPRKAFIAIPTYSGEINYLTMVCVTRAIAEARENGWEADVGVRATDSLLCRARNVLVAAFLKTDATDLVFWDADVAAEPGAFVR